MVDIPLMPNSYQFSSSKPGKHIFGFYRYTVYILLFLACGCFIWGGVTWRNYRYEKNVKKTFEQAIFPLIEAMRRIPGPDLSFLPENLENIPFVEQEYPEDFALNLREQFTQAVDAYKKEQLLRIELDIDKILTGTSIEGKLAQLFIFGVQGTSLSFDDANLLLNKEPGGVILMGKNIDTNTATFTEQLQKINKEIPLFIAIDQEGLPVARIAENLPGQAEVSLEKVCDIYTTRDTLLSNKGINMNFGLVADTTNNPSSYIASRVFSGHVGEKIEQAIACTEKIFSTAKHFPGHGAIQGDSHQGVQYIQNISCDEMKATHFLPFLTAIDANIDLVMMGHLILPCLDELYPASLSLAHTNKLRERGFTGLIITDDMDMLRSNYSREEALEYALRAGNDLILYVDNTAKRKEILNYARELYDQGVFDAISLDARLRRILEKKNEYIRSGIYVSSSLYLW